MAKKTTLTDELIYEIYKAEGSLKEIAKKYGVSASTVRRIKNLEYKKYEEAIKRIEEAKHKQQSVPKNKQVTTQGKNQILIEKIAQLNKEMFIADIISLLDKYFTALVVKCVYDNILTEPKFEELIEKTIDQIKKVNDPKYYIEAVKTIFLGIILQIVKEDQVPNLLGVANGKNEETK
jgi:transposase-like protein